MPRPRIVTLLLAAVLTLPSIQVSAEQSAREAAAVRVATTQNVTVGLIAGGSGSTDTRVAADMAQVLDDGDKLRVLPMLGQGSVQNIADLIYLKGVDLAIVHTDVLTQTMQRGTIPRESSVQYIAKLFPEEIQVLARNDIASLNDLNGKAVSFGATGGGTDLTASALFDMSHISPAVTHDSPTVALARLRRGEIAAMVVIGGEPVPMLQAIEPGTGLHFVPIPLTARLVDTYLPTRLDHRSYPNLVPAGPPIDTVAVGSILITLSTPADTARAKRVNRFVDTLFERFDRFRQPGFHPKWHEVALSAQVPGWTRYPQAQTLLKKEQTDKAKLRTSFDAFLSKSGQTAAGISDKRREALFRDFLRWRNQQGGP